MNTSVWKRGGVCLTAVAVMAGVAGCQGDGGTEKKSAPAAEKAPAGSSASEVITAAYKKTSEAKSAKVRMTLSMPESTGMVKGDIEMSGVMGWDPSLMDMTMKGDALSAETSGLSEIRMVWVDDVMYMDMGAEAAKEMEGKRWMKLDVAAVAEASGDKALEKQMTGGLENMNQDPAQQLALLLDSPQLKHVGSEKVDGVDAEHYKGTLSVDEMMKSNDSLAVLDAQERKALIDSLKKSGMETYDTEVWVNEDNYPVKMDIGMKTTEGTMKISTHYSDYGAKTQVTAPPAGETFDLAEMMAGLGDESTAGAAS
ncbi:hypothetical protein ACIQVO_25345 [Streptomyces sp. NPDC101062]|uniref:hypothetical protein n=1 Tax=unclassified Streptomyces TaxID=2593676 RepID=UPI002E7892EC|nr:hypothetical protein [Streptomyces sp. JV176]MEE1803809.1 hypothetical protein [Streptomyces sp. JV176]